MSRKAVFISLILVVSIALYVGLGASDKDRVVLHPVETQPESVGVQEPLNTSFTPPAQSVDSTTANSTAVGNRTAKQGYFAPSLAGTDIDGELRVDHEGNLLVTRGTRDLFDYFLSTVGERSLDEILDQIRAYARERLPPEAAAETARLLEDYVTYKLAERNYLAQDMDQQQNDEYVQTLDRVLEQLVALRRQHFTPDQAEALFGVEEAYGIYALERMRISSDSQLAPQQREQLLADLDKSAPPEIREVKNRTTGLVLMEQHLEKMREQGATEVEVMQYREERVGPEEAQRLAKIDAENADWERRYSQYSQQRKQIAESAGLSEVDKEAALERVRAQFFTGIEIDRARVSDQMAN